MFLSNDNLFIYNERQGEWQGKTMKILTEENSIFQTWPDLNFFILCMNREAGDAWQYLFLHSCLFCLHLREQLWWQHYRQYCTLTPQRWLHHHQTPLSTPPSCSSLHTGHSSLLCVQDFSPAYLTHCHLQILVHVHTCFQTIKSTTYTSKKLKSGDSRITCGIFCIDIFRVDNKHFQDRLNVLHQVEQLHIDHGKLSQHLWPAELTQNHYHKKQHSVPKQKATKQTVDTITKNSA